MKKNFLILQFRTDQSLDHEKKCFKRSLDISDDSVQFINVFERTKPLPLPKPEEIGKYTALITAASGEYNITDLPDWARERVGGVSEIFTHVIEIEFPTLAVCFGHQLMAEVLGGKVARDPDQAEAGTVLIKLGKDGQNSELFKGIPKQFYAVSGHKESVTKLPEKAKLLASSSKTEIHAYQVGKKFFSVQFHPELNTKDLTYRLSIYPEYTKGKKLEDIVKSYKKTPYPSLILKNFKKLATSY